MIWPRPLSGGLSATAVLSLGLLVPTPHFTEVLLNLQKALQLPEPDIQTSW